MIKDTGDHPDGRDAQGQVCGRGAELPCLSQHTALPAPPCVSTPEALRTPCFGDIYGGGFITQA